MTKEEKRGKNIQENEEEQDLYRRRWQDAEGLLQIASARIYINIYIRLRRQTRTTEKNRTSFLPLSEADSAVITLSSLPWWPLLFSLSPSLSILRLILFYSYIFSSWLLSAGGRKKNSESIKSAAFPLVYTRSLKVPFCQKYFNLRKYEILFRIKEILFLLFFTPSYIPSYSFYLYFPHFLPSFLLPSILHSLQRSSYSLSFYPIRFSVMYTYRDASTYISLPFMRIVRYLLHVQFVAISHLQNIRCVYLSLDICCNMYMQISVLPT